MAKAPSPMATVEAKVKGAAKCDFDVSAEDLLGEVVRMLHENRASLSPSACPEPTMYRQPLKETARAE